MAKNLPAIDFHAAVAKRDPALAERLAREGLSTPALVVEDAPTSEPTSPKPSTEAAARKPQNDLTPRRRRGLVPRANGQDAGRITVYVPPALALRLKQFCFDCDRTMSDVAGEVLVDALERKLRQRS
jgi:hypothetical protein